MRGHACGDNLLGDYCDGTDMLHHPLFSIQNKALQIMLYFDEVEVCNPLGTKVKVHKLGDQNIQYSSPVMCQLLSM